jgi:two-component system response regulator YesN
LVDFIDWSSFGVGEILTADNGLRGLELAERHLPDIIITDIKMPKMDGLSLGVALRRILPECVIIVISGYDDFVFAKQTIAFGGYDYLLKPIQRESLLGVMVRVAGELDSRRSRLEAEQALKARLLDGGRKKRERLLRDILAGHGDEAGSLECAEELDATLFMRGIVAVALKVDLSRHIGDENSAGWKACAESLYRCARSVVDEAGIVAPVVDAMGEVAICLPNDGREAVSDTIERLLRECGGLGADDLAVGVGDASARVEDFLESYGQARLALDRLFLEDAAAIVFYADLERRALGERAVDPQEALLRRISSPEARADSFDAADVFDFIRASAFDRGEIRAYFAGLLGRLALLASANAELFSSFSLADAEIPETMDSFVRLRRMEDWFLDIARAAIGGIAERTRRREARVAEETLDIIRKEYADNIGISTIADRLGISANYLGSLFKQCAGKPFTQALTEFRMAKADELLAAGDRNVGDVARAVGYRNSGYFASVYRKLRGVAPSGRQSGCPVGGGAGDAGD